jgi:hypothetical protein
MGSLKNGSVRLATVLALLGSGGCCWESQRDVTISGTVRYDAFTSGEILLMLAEAMSTRCSGTSMSGQTPGFMIDQVTLSEPGRFTLAGTVCWADSPPELDLTVWARDPAQSGPCQAGAGLVLPPQNASDVEMALVEGVCPMRS